MFVEFVTTSGIEFVNMDHVKSALVLENGEMVLRLTKNKGEDNSITVICTAEEFRKKTQLKSSSSNRKSKSAAKSNV